MDGSNAPGSSTDVANPGAEGATPMDSWDEIRDNLKAFTDSVHAKASQVVSWIQAAEPLQTDGSTRPLDLKILSLYFSRPLLYSW